VSDSPAERRGAERDEETPDSILGSLPRSRPAVRSPRRDAAQARAKREPRPAPSAPPRREAAPEPDESRDLEELARAGATTTAQVVAAGLRFAGKAASAIRDSIASR
jgi:hypothetical protein